MKTKNILALFSVVLLILFVGCTQTRQSACTEEALVCPDGSAVGRVPPNCSFAPCPNCKCPEGYIQEGETCNPACYYGTPRCLMPSVLCNETQNLSQKKNVSKNNMMLIPAGTFLMGREQREGWSPMAAPEIFNDELPPHEVYVDAFYIDKYEVTNRQFKEFVDAAGYVTDAEKGGDSNVLVPAEQADTPILGTDIGWKVVAGATWRTPEGPNSSIENLMDYPVVHVSWNDANAYAKWVGKRLLTEAEWEKAARGGTETNWFWGDELGSAGKYANLYGEHRKDYNYSPEVYDGFSKTAPVGSLQPNNYGLYDTAGNVFEWISDWYQYDYFSNSPKNNPQGPTSGEGRVIKGGSWYFCECYLRPANRQQLDALDRNHGLGFRLALDANS